MIIIVHAQWQHILFATVVLNGFMVMGWSQLKSAYSVASLVKDYIICTTYFHPGVLPLYFLALVRVALVDSLFMDMLLIEVTLFYVSFVAVSCQCST